MERRRTTGFVESISFLPKSRDSQIILTDDIKRLMSVNSLALNTSFQSAEEVQETIVEEAAKDGKHHRDIIQRDMLSAAVARERKEQDARALTSAPSTVAAMFQSLFPTQRLKEGEYSYFSLPSKDARKREVDLTNRLLLSAQQQELDSSGVDDGAGMVPPRAAVAYIAEPAATTNSSDHNNNNNNNNNNTTLLSRTRTSSDAKQPTNSPSKQQVALLGAQDISKEAEISSQNQDSGGTVDLFMKAAQQAAERTIFQSELDDWNRAVTEAAEEAEGQQAWSSVRTAAFSKWKDAIEQKIAHANNLKLTDTPNEHEFDSLDQHHIPSVSKSEKRNEKNDMNTYTAALHLQQTQMVESLSQGRLQLEATVQALKSMNEQLHVHHSKQRDHNTQAPFLQEPAIVLTGNSPNKSFYIDEDDDEVYFSASDDDELFQ